MHVHVIGFYNCIIPIVVFNLIFLRMCVLLFVFQIRFNWVFYCPHMNLVYLYYFRFNTIFVH
ncbi:hypothetical protein JHK82_027338 [Glycine max]|uniref:Uncharacterized protein n=2 Tax=Glycine subgen. Soja TaxID=1462606 RepID=K7LI40_SOYBN|nr:hypothetical protein JHK82_027338 [Glycine max]KAH1137357.1 hypothetical protein GYH30_027374 [Glycine max]KRH32890.1 hypothetical protein GLYMA_10G084100v4 [Glycine max]RZB86313.1 hypothetical protein D0Y65_026389 [Glycine soja]